jgi:hypothetical protein
LAEAGKHHGCLNDWRQKSFDKEKELLRAEMARLLDKVKAVRIGSTYALIRFP